MQQKLPRNVILLGIVSFFNDLSAEMIYPIVPIFLTSVLKTSIPVVGLIEGIVEATASISKYFFGTISDYFQKRKPFVIAGYTFAGISKILIGLAYSWPLVLFARFIDRSGKGLRTAPRDSILLENTTTTNRGFIFGFHRSLDSLGAVLGPLAALGLLYILQENIRLTFFIAAIPSLIGVMLLIFFVTEKKKETPEKKTFVKLNWSTIHPQLKIFLLISFIFALGNSADSFLILRSHQLGLTTTATVLAYVLYNVVQTLFATPAGQISDKVGAKRVFAAGLIVFSVVYFFFGLIQDARYVWFLFPIYGLYIAFTDGISKAYVSEFITEKESGTYFGFYFMLTALGNFFASFIGGILWSVFSPSATFWYGSLMAGLAFVIYIISKPLSSKINKN
jgi:MFS family permease